MAGRLITEVARLLRVDLARASQVVDLADHACAIADDQALVARAWRARANLHHFKGEQKEAAELYRRAVEQLDELDESVEAAVTRSSALVALAYLDEYELLERWARQAERVFREAADTPRLGRLMANLAGIEFRRDDLSSAARLYERALSVFEGLGDLESRAALLRNLAVCWTGLLEFDEASRCYEAAGELCRQADLRQLQAELDYNHAFLFYLRGDYHGALERLSEAARRAQRAGDRYHLALCDLDRAEIELELNRLGEAIQAAELAHRRFEESGVGYESARALSLLGAAQARRGQIKESLVSLAKARAGYESARSEVGVGRVDLAMASCFMVDGDLDRARDLGARALDCFETASRAGLSAAASLLLCRCCLQTGDEEGARLRLEHARGFLSRTDRPILVSEVSYLEGLLAEMCGLDEDALEAFEKAAGEVDRLCLLLGREDLAIAFLDAQSEIAEALVARGVAAGWSTDKIFTAAERAKSRSLTALLLTTESQESAADPTVLDRLKRTRDELAWCYRELDRLNAGGAFEPPDGQLAARIRGSERNLLESVRLVRRFDGRSDLGTVELDRLRADLPRGSQVVEFFVARGHVYALTIHADEATARRLGDVAELQKLHRLLHYELAKQARAHRGDSERRRRLADRAVASYLERLYETLVLPLESSIRERRLVVVPHGTLHSVPFHALGADAPWGDSHLISYSPSATSLWLCSRARPCETSGFLVVGAPDERAMHIESEVSTLRDAHSSADVLLGASATSSAFLAKAPEYRYLHVAAHGTFRRDSPMFSFLQLSDSRLSLADVYQLRLQAELVTLSSCESGVGLVSGADELIGFSRGFLAAGARSVLVSLWPVDDESTAQFMSSFYGHLFDELSPAEALAKASRELREVWPSPYHWAPFALVGALEDVTPVA